MTDTTELQSGITLKQGDFCHFEFPIKDVERAKTFYGEVFGWTFTDVPEMNYTLFQTPGGMSGGFFHPSEQLPERVINYLCVASIEETAEKIATLGGRLLGPKIEVPGYGYMMHLLDSEGSVIALWQA